jgi:hypothetical protein
MWTVLKRSQPGQGGPRYQWSRRVGCKTVTVALRAEQFAWLKEAIANQRQVWDILLQMQRQTVAYMWKSLPSTSRRKRLSKNCHSGHISTFDICPSRRVELSNVEM